MKILHGHDAEVAGFVAALIPNCARGFANYRATGILDDDGKLIAGVVYHNWEPEAGVIEMSSASVSAHWLTRKVLREIFGYPFRIGCQMIVFRVSERNTGLHRQFDALGLRRHVIPRLYGRDEAGIVFTLTDDDWSAGRFMRQSRGKTQSTNTA